MMDQMIIREATKSDVNEIYQLVNLAFNNNEESNLICDLITNDDVLINLVATSTTTILGNIVVSKMLLIPTLDLFCGAIGPLSVLPDYQSKGIGSKLIEIAISESKINKLDALFVLGSPKFYQKFGFKKSNLENEYNTQNFQELEITKECLTNIDSKIHYAEAFSNLS
jgi:putative acetyltransferase